MSPDVSRRLAAHASTGRPAEADVEEARRQLAAIAEALPPGGLATERAFAAGARTGYAATAAAQAAGDLTGAGADQVAEAAALGLEAGRQVEAALATSPARRPWPAGSLGAWIGAAVAAGRLVQLDPDRLLAALALACTQAQAIDPSGSGTIRFGKAAFDGVEAALLAEAGFTAPAAPIEGRRGLAALTAPGADLGGIAAGL